MKLKAACTDGIPEEVIKAFASPKFAESFLKEVCEGCLGAVHTLYHPSAFYVQKPDMTVNINNKLGIELRLTGVSRGTRDPGQFDEAITKLHELAVETTEKALAEADSKEEIEIFTVLMIDGEVPTSEGGYSSVHEMGPEWVSAAVLPDIEGDAEVESVKSS